MAWYAAELICIRLEMRGGVAVCREDIIMRQLCDRRFDIDYAWSKVSACFERHMPAVA